MNSVILSGNLGKQPESKLLPSGNTIATFSVAVSEKVKDDFRTNWFSCTAFGYAADKALSLGKGSKVVIMGRLRQDTWEKDGEKKSMVKVTVNDIKELASSKDGDSDTVRGQLDSFTADDIPF